MKQGRSGRDVSESSKREPMAHEVSVGKVARIGIVEVSVGSGGKPLYPGRGYEAPMNKSRSRNNGSQGEY